MTNFLLKKIEAETFYYILFFVLWSSSLFTYIRGFFSHIPFLGLNNDSFFACFFGILIIGAIPYLTKNLNFMYVYVYFLIVFAYELCFCLFPDNSVYLYKEEYRYLFQILPLFFIGVKFQNSEEIMKMLLVVAVASVVCVFFYNVVYHRIDIDENMVTAYNVLPNVLFLFAYYLYKREKWILFPIFLGLFLLFVLGTRGPVMACVLCAFVLCIKFFFDGFYKKSFVLFSMWVFFYVGIHLFSLQLENLFQRMGVSTRVLMSLIYAAKIDSSGRDLIYMKIYENIDFLKAHGFAGDRLLLGTYSHNMFLEIWYSFGFLGGSILLLCIFAIVLGALYYSKNIDSFFLIVLISFVFGQLMFSGSYLHQKWLFFLIGYSINIITKERNSISNTKKYFKRMC